MKAKQILIFLLLVGMVWSCRTKDDNSANPSIVGEWTKELTKEEIYLITGEEIVELNNLDAIGIKYTILMTMEFKKDNTGSATGSITVRGISKKFTYPLTWSTDGNTLTIKISGMEQIEENKFTYSISGNKLTLTASNSSLTLTRK